MYIVQYAKRTSCLSLGLGLAVSISSFGLYIIQLRKKEIRVSLWLGLAVDILQFCRV